MERVLVNGSPDAASLSPSDRGLCYGDGLFETIAVNRGKPCLLDRHFRRLLLGASRLQIPPPDRHRLFEEIERVIAGQAMGVVKIILTRGPGKRGYDPQGAGPATRIVSFTRLELPGLQPGSHPLRVRICDQRLGLNASLAGIKHLNRLEQVLARMELQEGVFDEGIMLDVQGHAVEAISGNIFLLEDDRLITPVLDECGVHGVVRELVMELAPALGLSCTENRVDAEALYRCDALLLCNSLIGLRAVTQLQQHRYQPRRSLDELIRQVNLRAFTPAR